MKKKKRKNFWTNFSAIVGSLAGIISAIAVVIQLLQPSGDSTKPEMTPEFKNSLEQIEAKIIDLERQNNDITNTQPSSTDGLILSPVLITIHEGDSYWAKDGYYLGANNVLKIWPSQIAKNSAFIKITDSENNIITSRVLQTFEKMIFSFHETYYEISLEKTGKAGKNPFVKAAFFTVKISE